MGETQTVNTPVKLYTTPFCPYCLAARRLLEEQDIPYESINISDKANIREFLFQNTGRRTVPQILIHDRPIGGYTDLLALSQEGKLESMLAKGEKPE